MTIEIPLTQGKVAIIDDEDLPLVNQHKWHASSDGGRAFYAQTNVPSRTSGRTQDTIRMHRFITGAGAGEQVDHINHDTLDNTRANLRKCTTHQNCANSHAKKRSIRASEFKGVGRKKSGKWYARIEPRGKLIWLGSFDSEINAAKAYDKAARQHFGQFAYTNFQES